MVIGPPRAVPPRRPEQPRRPERHVRHDVVLPRDRAPHQRGRRGCTTTSRRTRAGRSATPWSIRGLFPFSGSNTGIFYAPADLTDRVIGAGGARRPRYYTLSVLGSDGNTYPPRRRPGGRHRGPVQHRLPPGVLLLDDLPDLRRVQRERHRRVQRRGSRASRNNAVGADPVEPGWMLSHFQVVYRTAYYCPPGERDGRLELLLRVQPSPGGGARQGCTTARPTPRRTPYFGGGEAMLEYYPGQTMTGTVQPPGRHPGVRGPRHRSTTAGGSPT